MRGEGDHISRIRLGFLVGILAALLIVMAGSRKKEEQASQAAGSGGAARYKAQPANWKETEVDVFPGMNGITLDPSNPDQKEALRGRIVWNLWIGDSGLMWDWLAQHGFGTADMLKTLDSRRRNTRFAEIGIINFNVAEFFVPRQVTGGGGQPVKIPGRDEESFVWQLIHSSPPGALDTSECGDCAAVTALSCQRGVLRIPAHPGPSLDA